MTRCTGPSGFVEDLWNWTAGNMAERTKDCHFEGEESMPRYMVILQTTEEGVWTKFFDDRWAAEEYAQTGEMALNAVTELYERTNGCYECIR